MPVLNVLVFIYVECIKNFSLNLLEYNARWHNPSPILSTNCGYSKPYTILQVEVVTEYLKGCANKLTLCSIIEDLLNRDRSSDNLALLQQCHMHTCDTGDLCNNETVTEIQKYRSYTPLRESNRDNSGRGGFGGWIAETLAVFVIVCAVVWSFLVCCKTKIARGSR